MLLRFFCIVTIGASICRLTLAAETNIDQWAAVAMDSANGQIVYLYNPELAAERSYTAGSIIKPVVAALALQQDQIDPQKAYKCLGSVQVSGERLECWLKQGHGPVNLYKALALSCNCYFYELGRSLDGDQLLFFLRQLGLGEKTGIDLPAEDAGNVPDAIDEKGRMLLAVGMTKRLRLTVVQAAVFFAALTNGGRVLVPHRAAGPADVRRCLTFSSGYSRLARALHEASSYGTTAEYGVQIGGMAKTGTAPWSDGYHTHGWFLGTIPLPSRTVVLAVFVMQGTGPVDAVPLAIRIARKLQLEK